MSQEEIGIEELQVIARTGTLAEFKQLLEEWGAEKVDGDEEGGTGRDYLKQAIESETDSVSAKDAKLAAIEEYDLGIQEDAVTANKIAGLSQVALTTVTLLREQFKQSVTRFEGELAKRDAAIADLTTKLEKTEQLALAAAKRAGELTTKVGALETELKTVKKPGILNKPPQSKP